MGSLGVAKADRNVAKAHTRAAEVGPALLVGLEPTACFYARLRQTLGTDINLEQVLRGQREAHRGVEL